MNDIRTRELYSSPNGDRWHLCKDASSRVFVVHQANIPSGGHISRIELVDFDLTPIASPSLPDAQGDGFNDCVYSATCSAP